MKADLYERLNKERQVRITNQHQKQWHKKIRTANREEEGEAAAAAAAGAGAGAPTADLISYIPGTR